MAAERYLSRRIPDLRVGNNIDEIDKKLIPASIHPWQQLINGLINEDIIFFYHKKLNVLLFVTFSSIFYWI